MSEQTRSKLEQRLCGEANKIASSILTVLEANKVGRVASLSDKPKEAEIVEKEFSFLRKSILDAINDYKRIVSTLLRRFDIEEAEGLVIKLTPTSKQQ